MTVSVNVRQEDAFDLASDPEALRRVPAPLALGHDVLALAWDGDELHVALPEGSQSDAIDRIRFVTGTRVRATVAPREAIRARLARVYGSERGSEHADRGESPVERLLDDIVAHAVDAGASDIHLEPHGGGGRVRLRVSGSMVADRSIPMPLFERVVARLKLLAGMDVADRRQPQDGRYGAGRVDARVASIPTRGGEKLVVRLIDSSTPLALDRLGMSAEMLVKFREAIRASHGCILVAGPTGSGKTTTLYAALRDLGGSALNLCSIEDPVEVLCPEVTQVQVCEKAGLTFASALRSIVRQDPDALMIGEIRDAESAHAATAAALAGHLVVSSIHAADAEGALERLVEFGVSRRTIAAGVRCVLSQRLVQRSAGSGIVRTGTFVLSEIDGRGRPDDAGRAS